MGLPPILSPNGPSGLVSTFLSAPPRLRVKFFFFETKLGPILPQFPPFTLAFGSSWAFPAPIGLYSLRICSYFAPQTDEQDRVVRESTAMANQKTFWIGRFSLAACFMGGAASAQQELPPPANLPLAPAPIVGNQPAGAPATKIVATVNGENILQGDLDAGVKQLGPSQLQLGTNKVRQQQLEALGLLIDELLMQQFLKQNAPEVPVAEVEKKFAELTAELKKQGKSLDDLCKENGFTKEQIHRNLKTRLQWLGYAATKIKEEELHKYWQDNRDFFDGVMVHASHIAVRTPPGTPPKEKEDLMKRMGVLRGQIVAGQIDFAAAAKKYSQEANAAQGGDLGFIPRKWAVEEPFAKVAFAMKPGEISQPVATEFAIHLIKVNDRRAGKPNDYKRLAPDVKEFYTEEMFQSILAGLRKGAKIDVFLQ